jgi:hypothetical protein
MNREAVTRAAASALSALLSERARTIRRATRRSGKPPAASRSENGAGARRPVPYFEPTTE